MFETLESRRLLSVEGGFTMREQANEARSER